LDYSIIPYFFKETQMYLNEIIRKKEIICKGYQKKGYFYKNFKKFIM